MYNKLCKKKKKVRWLKIKFFLNIISLINVQEFKQRFVSTVVLFLIFLFLIFLGNPLLSILFSLLFSLIFFEFEKLINIINKNLQIFKIILLQLVLIFFVVYNIFKLQILPNFFNEFFFFLSLCIFINFIFLIYKNTNLVNIIVSNIIIFSLFSLVGILQKPNGLNEFLYLVILVSTMDIFAYLGGKLFGRNKIIPKISKGKTVEGTLVGIIFTIMMSCLIKELIDQDIFYSFILGLIISILAFFGDLIESVFKRNVGVKNSGKIIPGHGGLMDRFDGYFLVIPFSYFFIN